ncbi:hypothetical protein JW905_19250 [bacterium]|nr:hypothetical protein [candidate division CSSED10-310 bacterium]
MLTTSRKFTDIRSCWASPYTNRRMVFPRAAFVRILALIIAVCLFAPVSAEDTRDSLEKMRDFNAVQTIYRNGVPHTDKNGRLLTKYDPERSFFQIAVWGNPIGNVHGYEYDLKLLTDAGMNTMWPYYTDVEAQLEAGRQAGLQVVIMGKWPVGKLEKVKDHPNWLGVVWHDEPTGNLWGKDMEGKYQEFLDYKVQINELAPGRAVFINDCPWITAPATQWWVKWNTAGDVSCHDNYPIMNRKYRARTLDNEELKTGIPESVNLAVAVNKEQRPVWFIVGAFLEVGNEKFPFRMPTPMQLRAQVYAAIIHGASGIIYFAWDSWVTRDGRVIGMSPDPQLAYPCPDANKIQRVVPTPMQLAESKAAWMATTQVNKELHELTPSLLSPTVGQEIKYTVATKGEHVTDVPIRCLLKPHPDGGYILLTVNLDDAVLSTTFEFPDGLKTVTPMFENREPYELALEQTSFTDRFDPFDVHVYRIATARQEVGQAGRKVSDSVIQVKQ